MAFPDKVTSTFILPFLAVFVVCVRLFHRQVSAIEQESIDIDQDTKDLLDALDFKDLAGVVVSAVPARV